MNVGIQLNFHLGQRVSHKGRAGYLKTLTIEDAVILGTIVLDEPIIYDAIPGIAPEVKIWVQNVPIHEIDAE